MICPHCGKETDKKEIKPLFCVELGRKHSYYKYNDDDEISFAFVDNVKTDLIWNKPIHFSNSLKDIIQLYRSLDCIRDMSYDGCISKLVDGAYLPGGVYEFPDGTYIWKPDQLKKGFTGCNNEKIETLDKFWRFRLWRSRNDNESDIVTCDPKGLLFLFNDLYTEKCKIPDECDRVFPPIYGPYLKPICDLYTEPSPKWDEIINIEWNKPITEFLSEFKTDYKTIYRVLYNRTHYF